MVFSYYFSLKKISSHLLKVWKNFKQLNHFRMSMLKVTETNEMFIIKVWDFIHLLSINISLHSTTLQSSTYMSNIEELAVVLSVLLGHQLPRLKMHLKSVIIYSVPFLSTVKQNHVRIICFLERQDEIVEGAEQIMNWSFWRAWRYMFDNNQTSLIY